MAFTFNWAGVQGIRDMTPTRQSNVRTDAANWGNFVKGYEQNKANKEYADMLENYQAFDESASNTKLAKLMSELASLKKRNAEIEAQLGG